MKKALLAITLSAFVGNVGAMEEQKGPQLSVPVYAYIIGIDYGALHGLSTALPSSPINIELKNQCLTATFQNCLSTSNDCNIKNCSDSPNVYGIRRENTSVKVPIQPSPSNPFLVQVFRETYDFNRPSSRILEASEELEEPKWSYKTSEGVIRVRFISILQGLANEDKLLLQAREWLLEEQPEDDWDNPRLGQDMLKLIRVTNILRRLADEASSILQAKDALIEQLRRDQIFEEPLPVLMLRAVVYEHCLWLFRNQRDGRKIR